MNIREFLEPIAGWFSSFGIPEPIVHWGHPLMMAIVIFVMGGFAVWSAWQGRLTKDGNIASKALTAHRQLMPWMYIFIAAGYTGGVLSLVMQEKPIFESSHFLTGSIVLILLGINAGIAVAGFPGDKQKLRSVHAYLGSIAFCLLVVHAVLGLRLGLTL